MSIPYRFAPWARRGLARAHHNPDTAGGALATRPHISVGLTLQAKQDGATVTAVSGNVDLTLYGPADIIGIDTRLIVRTEPKPGIRNFEPNYLAAIDFDPPDFPWLLTPAHADTNGRMRPWLVLVVVDRAAVDPPVLKPGQPLPSIEISAAAAGTELPDLNESWLWAHAQAVSEIGGADPDVAASGVISDASRGGLAQELKAQPARNISRLVCPRRLEARHDYLACVVPATEGGRLRGLGQPFAATDLGAAWGNGRTVELPVYFHWEFSTGPIGDIEMLARRLRTPKKYAGDAPLIASLKRIGEQDVAVDADHLLFNGEQPDQTIFEGAMVSLNFQPAAPSGTFAGRLQDMLNSGQASSTLGTELPDDVPTLSPPIYGEHPAKRHTVEAAKVSHWLDGLNCQPRYRLASGWGAEVVRQNQDEFMQAAWEQVGDVLAAERAFSLARLSRDVLKRIEAKHLAKLPPERLLAILSPARVRIRVSPTQSLYGQIESATLPHELFDGSMRRLTSARRPTFRLAQWRTRAAAHVPVATQMVALVQTFADASNHVAAVDPNHFVPDGLMGSSSFDGIALPADLSERVDLAPYLGLTVTMTGAEIKTIQAQNAAARRLAATLPRTAPVMDDVWRRGLITETHARRVAELEQTLGHPLAGDVARLIQDSSTRGTEGVLLSVSDGRVTSQPLRIDARSGAIKTAGAVRQLSAETARALPSRSGIVAMLPLQALQMYGNRSVFATLPPSTVLPGTRTSIALTRPGRFTARRAAGAEVATITVPPAIKDHATLTRYSDAFKAYQQMVVPPADSVPSVRAVNFPIAASAAAVRQRANPQETVPARLASMLSLGGDALTWTDGALSHLFVSARLDQAFDARLRYLIPRTFDRVMYFPHLRFPLSRKLEQLAPEIFLPGVGTLPTDFIMAVKTNPRFVEALMLGANHEMARELLWQGFPTDSRGTPFQRFWQRFDDEEDITPIHKWAKVPLGQQPGNTPKLVLLFRGQLLERFPTLSIYAYKIGAPSQTRPGGSVPPVPNDVQEMDPDAIITPFMRGHLYADITYVGFNIVPEKITDYFFVIEEHMTEPRFGFDEPDGPPSPNKSWLDVDWSEVGVARGDHFGAAKLIAASHGVTGAKPPRWLAPNAATVADAILQRPFRGYWRGDALKMP